MQNFGNTLANAQAESIQKQQDLMLKLEQMSGKSRNSNEKSDKDKIQIKRFICAKCGLLTERCICKPSSLESHLLHGAEKLEYQRDQMTHKQSNKQDLPRDVEIVRPEKFVNSKATKPKIQYVKPNLISNNFVNREGTKNAIAAKKREAVLVVQKEMISMANSTETMLDDKVAKHIVKGAKAIGFETAPSAIASGDMVQEYASDLINDVDTDELW